MRSAATEETSLRKELGFRDLVLAQVLCVVGSQWVGVAAKLGRAHVVFWLVAMLLFYLPLAAVVIYLNRLMPLEGGLYQWAKEGFGEMAGFLIAWNLWVYAVVVVGAIIFVVPTDISYMFPRRPRPRSARRGTARSCATGGPRKASDRSSGRQPWAGRRPGGRAIGASFPKDVPLYCPLSNSSPAAPGQPRRASRAGPAADGVPGRFLPLSAPRSGTCRSPQPSRSPRAASSGPAIAPRPRPSSRRPVPDVPPGDPKRCGWSCGPPIPPAARSWSEWTRYPPRRTRTPCRAGGSRR